MAKKDEAEAKPKAEAKAKADVKQETKAGQESQGGFSISNFFQGTKEELDKVVWPSRQQLISESFAVILMVTLSATIIYLVDQLFGWAAKQVF
ncbi:MAG TPA: preprotein translocase subunit SecE [Crinalium sp.]